MPTPFVNAGYFNGHMYMPKVGLVVGFAYRQQSNIPYVAGAMESNPLRYGIISDALYRSGPETSGTTRYIETRDAEVDEDPTVPSMLYAFSNTLKLLTAHPPMNAETEVLLSGSPLSSATINVLTKFSDADLISQGFDLDWLSTATDIGGFYTATSIKTGIEEHYDDDVYPLQLWAIVVQRLRHLSTSYEDLYFKTGTSYTTRHKLTYRPAFLQSGRMLVAVSGSYSEQAIDADEAPSNQDLDTYHLGDSYLLTNLTQFNDVTDFPTITSGELLTGPDSPPVLIGFIAFFDLELGVHRDGDPDAAGAPTTGTHYEWVDPIRGTDPHPFMDILFQITDAKCREYWQELVDAGDVEPVEPGEAIYDTGSGDFEVPAGVFIVVVELWGGGGGGGAGGGGSGSNGGSGGGGGGYCKITLSVTPGQLIPYSVGIGGSGGLDAGTGLGANGTASTAAGTLTASGGGGGDYGDNDPTVASTGGGASGGTVNTTGGAGAAVTSGNDGSDGGSAPLGGVGGTGGIESGAAAGGGAAPGGGGGGGAKSGEDGGAGAAGRVKFTY